MVLPEVKSNFLAPRFNARAKIRGRHCQGLRFKDEQTRAEFEYDACL